MNLEHRISSEESPKPEISFARFLFNLAVPIKGEKVLYNRLREGGVSAIESIVPTMMMATIKYAIPVSIIYETLKPYL